jgi:putative ABC transport system permease protein
MKAKDTTSGTSTNSALIAPLSRVQRSLTGYGSLSSLTLQATSTTTVDAAAAEAKAVIASQLKVSTSELSVNVTTQEELLSATSEVNSSLSAMLAAIAAISLVVGGIGVMNIMLVTVSERTREIGIRKALGAGQGVISAQFITEATILSTAGGLLGVLAATAASRFTILGTKPVITSNSVLLALGVSVAIGIVFGGYPAIRASAMKPVDALRHE